MSKSTLLSIIFYRTDILFSARSLFQLFPLLSYICLQRWDGKLQEINGTEFTINLEGTHSEWGTVTSATEGIDVHAD